VKLRWGNKPGDEPFRLKAGTLVWEGPDEPA